MANFTKSISLVVKDEQGIYQRFKVKAVRGVYTGVTTIILRTSLNLGTDISASTTDTLTVPTDGQIEPLIFNVGQAVECYKAQVDFIGAIGTMKNVHPAFDVEVIPRG